ncbi:MAG: hypothetical protein ACI93T_001478, partial [Porticoccaceae bacterium]
SNFRIAEIFVQAAINSLKPGGRLHFVTKQPEWFADRFVEVFDEVSVLEARGYFVVKATQLTPQSESVWGSSPSKSSTSDAPVNGGDEEA